MFIIFFNTVNRLVFKSSGLFDALIKSTKTFTSFYKNTVAYLYLSQRIHF